MSRVYKYQSQQPLFAHTWSCREDRPMRMAVCSCDDENRNFVELVKLRKSSQALMRLDTMAHQFPVTKVQFMPSLNTQNEDLLITSSDCLRIYKIVPDNNSERMTASGFLRSDKRRPSPVTSFDWSPLALNIVASASFDTLISIWDLNKEVLDIQFAGHERAVNDLCFSPHDANVFVTCSTDGCLRLFDRRHMEYSNQLYETTGPLLRCGFNKIDSNFIGFVESDKQELGVLDIRNTASPIFLKRHTKAINGFAWSPSQQNIILSCAEDGNCFVWDIQKTGQPKPTMGYDCREAAASCQWSGLNKEWCSVVHGQVLEILHI
ncbi:WD40_repeat protein [Hexamita inflata]|uniref:WD40 repeat protein n=1 Tax=Hexamita inflata TaxID=28002 RepID=A0AA86R7E9_9EUKA|nr:WD40 repeat protein [Hexamita inflata]CAI9951095.1 WD40 repeat protein [Hexamita inflata]CAI9967429.1 WD40 repeat protein [Hexamita inflata]